jgi:signal transduction histidine kinase
MMYQQNAYLLIFAAALQIGYLISSSLHLQPQARTTTWKIWVFGCVCLTIGPLLLSHQFYHLPASLNPDGPLFEVGFGFCLLGAMNVFYLFDDLQGVSKKKSLVEIFIFLLVGNLLVGSVGSFIDRLIAKDIVMIFYALWLLRKVMALRERKTFVEAEPLLVSLIIFLVFSLYYLWVFLDYQFSNAVPESLAKTFIESMDIQVFITVFIYMTLGFHWTSEGAKASLKYKLDNERITGLLREKDLLIQNLLKANVLVESGALSAGISHELNQFLSVIQVNSELAIHALHQGEQPEVVEQYVENAIKSNQLAATLISSLKRFFSKREEVPQLCVIDELISEAVDLYRDRLKKSKIELVLNLAAKEEVTLRRPLMRQVIGNLLVNAIEALDLISRKDKLIQIRSQITHGQLEFSISDNGPGLNEALAGDVFSLFQTSKNHGTGLGLWLSLHIVEKHHGCISHSNLPSGGVEFKVSIPFLSDEDILTASASESNLMPEQ